MAMIDLSNTNNNGQNNNSNNLGSNNGSNSNNSSNNGSNSSNNSNNSNLASFMASSGPSIINALQHQQKPQNPILDKLINYNKLAKQGKFNRALFRDTEITNMIAALSTQDHPNVLLTGEAGVGKTNLVEELATRLVNGDKVANTMLGKDTVIYELPLTNLIANTTFRGDLENLISNLIKFAKDPKNHAIIYIDEIHQLFTSHSSTYDTIAQQLKPALSRGDVHVITSTTTQEARFLKNDSAFARRFIEIKVPEFTRDQMAQLLIKVKPKYEKFYNLTFDDNQALDIVQIAHKYNVYRHDPDLTMTLVDRTMSNYKTNLIASGMNANNLNISTNVFENNAKKILAPTAKQPNAALKVDNILKQSFVGQEKAVKSVHDELIHMDLDLIDRTRPYSFLFAGPSGTGKTQLAKYMAKGLYGSEKSYIYLNMTEYSDPASITKLIGSSAGYVGSDSSQPLPLDSLETNPYQIIVLDEFEKACQSVKQLFMQALDEGEIETNRNTKINFKNAIIIATTNGGVASHVSIGFNSTNDDSSTITNLSSDFPIELLNRFEHVIMFEPISKDQYIDILRIKYNQFAQKIYNHSQIKVDPYQIKQANIPDFLQELADKSYDPTLNGRPAERTVMEYLEDQVSKQLIIH